MAQEPKDLPDVTTTNLKAQFIKTNTPSDNNSSAPPPPHQETKAPQPPRLDVVAEMKSIKAFGVKPANPFAVETTKFEGVITLLITTRLTDEQGPIHYVLRIAIPEEESNSQTATVRTRTFNLRPHYHASATVIDRGLEDGRTREYLARVAAEHHKLADARFTIASLSGGSEHDEFLARMSADHQIDPFHLWLLWEQLKKVSND